LHWIFRPTGDLFVVDNHNVPSLVDHWHLESNPLLVKLQKGVACVSSGGPCTQRAAL